MDRLSANVRINKRTGCWEWSKARFVNGGYGAINIGGKIMRAHVVSYELHWGRKREPGNVIAHTCHNPSCINPSHLVQVTQQANLQMSRDVKRIVPPTGKRNGRSKLTMRQARAIRKSTRTLRALAETYGVDHKTIHAIKAGRTWRETK